MSRKTVFFLISIFEQNNEIKNPVLIATWNAETSFYLEIKGCMQPYKLIHINRFLIFENSFKLSLNMYLKLHYVIMNEYPINI